jgi:two-component system sensor histidine kinase AlgZ
MRPPSPRRARESVKRACGATNRTPGAHVDASPRSHRSRSDWSLIALGWCGLTLTVTLGSFPFLRERASRWYVSALAVSLCAASVALSVVCVTLWERRRGWPRITLTIFAVTYGLGFACAALATEASGRFGFATPRPFNWRFAFDGALTAWFALTAWSAAYFGIQHARRARLAESMARDAELRALRYQVNPHFLFNTLNTISSLVTEGRTATATHMLARLGDFFRSTLVDERAVEVLLADEIALAEQYLDIEKARLGDRLTVALHISPQALPMRVPHLLLQPLIENAIRHGIAPLNAGGRLEIRAWRNGADVHVSIRNDAPPTGVPGTGSSSRGIGLRNTADRLRHVYGSDHAFEVGASGGGAYEVHMRLPFR